MRGWVVLPSSLHCHPRDEIVGRERLEDELGLGEVAQCMGVDDKEDEVRVGEGGGLLGGGIKWILYNEKLSWGTSKRL